MALSEIRQTPEIVRNDPATVMVLSTRNSADFGRSLAEHLEAGFLEPNPSEDMLRGAGASDEQIRRIISPSTDFPNGELHLMLPRNAIRRRVAIVVGATNSPADFVEMQMLLRSVATAMPHELHAMIPFIGNSTNERERAVKDYDWAMRNGKSELEIYTGHDNRYVDEHPLGQAHVDFLKFAMSPAGGQQSFTTIDTHVQTQAAFGRPMSTHQITTHSRFAQNIQAKLGWNVDANDWHNIIRAVISPDEGHAKVSATLAERLGVPLEIFIKTRDAVSGLTISKPLIDDPERFRGAEVVILDDIGRSMGTLGKAARTLKEMLGVSKVTAAVSHAEGLATNTTRELNQKAFVALATKTNTGAQAIDAFMTTNTVPGANSIEGRLRAQGIVTDTHIVDMTMRAAQWFIHQLGLPKERYGHLV